MPLDFPIGQGGRILRMNNKFAVVVSFIASLLFLVGYSLANTANEGTSTKQNTVDDSAKDSGNFLNQSFMPTPDKIQQWHLVKDAGGPTLSGSPSWKSYTAFLEEHYRACGLVDIKKDVITYNRWFTSDDRKAGNWTLSVDGKEVPVASYWAYSGSTPPSGCTAPLIYYDQKNPPASIEGKIVVFDTPSLPESLPPDMLKPSFEYASDPESLPTDSFTADQFYQVNYYARFSGWKEIITKGKASGALVISNMGPARAAGVYTLPPPPSEFGVPGLFLDRVAGRGVRAAAKEGRTATLKLIVMREKAETYFLSGYLPGKNYGREDDEMILLISHTDGPAISQENGGLGILAVIEYFSHILRSERSRTLLVVLDPQHYMPGRHSVDWFKLHPEIASKVVASMGIEHLGQVEYRERGDDFLPTGKPEVTQLFVQDNDVLIKWAIKAVKDNHLPRTMVHCPLRKGQGRWIGMGDVAVKRNIPGYALSALMSAYWSAEARIDKFDKDLMWKQIAVAVQLIGELMRADLKEIAVPNKGGS